MNDITVTLKNAKFMESSVGNFTISADYKVENWRGRDH